MIRERVSFILKLYGLLDVGVVAISFSLAYVIRSWLSNFMAVPTLMNFSEYAPLLGAILPIWIGVLYLNKAYTSHRGKSYLPLVWTVVKTNVEGICILSVLFFMLKLHIFNRSLVFLFMLVCIFFLTVEKIILFKCLQYLRKQGRNIKRVLLIGTDPKVQVLMKHINQHPETGFVIAGLLSEHPEDIGRKIYGYKVFGTADMLYQVLHQEIIDEVIFTTPIFALHRIKRSLEVCELLGINCRIFIEKYDEASHFKMFIDSIIDIPLLSFSYREKQFFSLGLKRLIDLFVSGILLLILSPLLLALGIMIKRESPGPAIFKQVRSGLNGRKFVMYKFRTMIDGAEALRNQLFKQNQIVGPIFKMEDDPRITLLGKYLRRTSLDELPQLWNVFKGGIFNNTAHAIAVLSFVPGGIDIFGCHFESSAKKLDSFQKEDTV